MGESWTEELPTTSVSGDGGKYYKKRYKQSPHMTATEWSSFLDRNSIFGYIKIFYVISHFNHAYLLIQKLRTQMEKGAFEDCGCWNRNSDLWSCSCNCFFFVITFFLFKLKLASGSVVL